MYSDNHQPDPTDTPQAYETEPQPLHICDGCESELVYPINWVAEAPLHWRILLRCPNCEITREGIFTEPTIDVFADALYRGETALLSTLARLSSENMSDAV